MSNDLAPQLDELIAALSGESPLKALKILAKQQALQALPAEKKLPYHLLPLLQNPHPAVRLEAIVFLGQLKQWHKAVEAVFLALSHNDQYDDHYSLYRQLSSLCSGDPRIAEMLMTALNSHIGYVRYQAACALGLLGLQRWEQITALEAAAQDENPRVREAAQHAILQLQRPTAPKPIEDFDNADENHGDRMGFLEID